MIDRVSARPIAATICNSDEDLTAPFQRPYAIVYDRLPYREREE